MLEKFYFLLAVRDYKLPYLDIYKAFDWIAFYLRSYLNSLLCPTVRPFDNAVFCALEFLFSRHMTSGEGERRRITG